MKVISIAKDPANCEGRDVEKHEQIAINIMLNDPLKSPTMTSPNAKDEITFKKQVEKRKILERRLNENTVKMNKIKKTNKL